MRARLREAHDARTPARAAARPPERRSSQPRP
jgi:hypothetical protein